jgi:hypothetical protein
MSEINSRKCKYTSDCPDYYLAKRRIEKYPYEELKIHEDRMIALKCEGEIVNDSFENCPIFKIVSGSKYVQDLESKIEFEKDE